MSLEAAIVRVCVFQGFTPRFHAVKKRMSDELWLLCGIEATEAEIKGGRWLTHSGWVLASVAAGGVQRYHSAALISSSPADSDRVRYQLRQAG